MMSETTTGIPINNEIIRGYFKRLVDKLFKILPMRENNEESLTTYMQTLQVELLGLQEFIVTINNDADYLSILSILQYLIDNPDCSISVVKREVFSAISTCNRLRARFRIYFKSGVM